jgi:hypothetical protein
LETGLGGQFGISSGGKGGFGISTEWCRNEKLERDLGTQ